MPSRSPKRFRPVREDADTVILDEVGPVVSVCETPPPPREALSAEHLMLLSCIPESAPQKMVAPLDDMPPCALAESYSLLLVKSELRGEPGAARKLHLYLERYPTAALVELHARWVNLFLWWKRHFAWREMAPTMHFGFGLLVFALLERKLGGEHVEIKKDWGREVLGGLAEFF